MDKRIRDIIIGVACFFIFLIIVQFIFANTLPQASFEYSAYQAEQYEFNETFENLEIHKKNLEDFTQHVYGLKNIYELEETLLSILPDIEMAEHFFTSSDEQIRIMAQQVYDDALAYFGLEEVKLLDTVYATDVRYSAILNSPQNYLFFALTPDKEKIVSYIVTPTEIGYDMETMWELENASDVAYTQMVSGNLLHIFNQQVF